MAWLEAPRSTTSRDGRSRDPYQPNLLPMDALPVELAREAATLVMLAAVGARWAERAGTPRLRAIAFGVWDVSITCS
jgi:hypothetical protein